MKRKNRSNSIYNGNEDGATEMAWTLRRLSALRLRINVCQLHNGLDVRQTTWRKGGAKET